MISIRFSCIIQFLDDCRICYQSDGTANGAIKWVNANNVNVAFTRAKEYIYVIGDATKWAELNKNLAFIQRYLPI